VRVRRSIGIILATASAVTLIGGCGDDSAPAGSTSSAAAPSSTTTAPPQQGEPAVGDGDGGVRLQQLGSFDQPLYVTQPPSGDDDHLYVVEQCGKIERLPIDGGAPSLFLDISDLVTCGGEQGLLSVAFAPDYADSGRLYVNYTDTQGNSRTVGYTRSAQDPSIADPGSAEELLRIEDFASNHNGGLLDFGPDGKLYLGMGDGGGAGDPERTAQDPSKPLGKLLVVDPNGSGGFEVAALGLRNPWRYSFDRKTAALWIGDVGQDSLEEVDGVSAAELAGAAGSPLNFGWSAFEGTERFNSDQQAPGAIAPVYEYGHDRGCSVTGGYVVRDRSLTSLYGRYLYGDYCEGELHSFTATPSRPATDDRPLGLHVDSLSSFGEDTSGRVYAVSQQGPVYRLEPAGG
jgi:glucose/arabinose dehydrogenase